VLCMRAVHMRFGMRSVRSLCALYALQYALYAIIMCVVCDRVCGLYALCMLFVWYFCAVCRRFVCNSRASCMRSLCLWAVETHLNYTPVPFAFAVTFQEASIWKSPIMMLVHKGLSTSTPLCQVSRCPPMWGMRGEGQMAHPLQDVTL
jgi:hypothetical protein